MRYVVLGEIDAEDFRLGAHFAGLPEKDRSQIREAVYEGTQHPLSLCKF